MSQLSVPGLIPKQVHFQTCLPFKQLVRRLPNSKPLYPGPSPGPDLGPAWALKILQTDQTFGPVGPGLQPGQFRPGPFALGLGPELAQNPAPDPARGRGVY